MARRACAATAGFALVLSLWLPWYSIGVPLLGTVNVTAWQAFRTVPIVILAAAIIGAAAALLDRTWGITDPLRLTKVAAAVAIVVIGYRVIVPPWQDSNVDPAWGAYLALIAGFGMLGAATGVASRPLGRLKTR